MASGARDDCRASGAGPDAERVPDDLFQAIQSGPGVAQVNTKDAAIASLQRLKVAQSLRGDQRPEAFVPAGDGQVLLRLRGDLQEDTGGRAPLVQLSGRVQEARAKAERRRHAERVAQPTPNALELCFDVLVFRQI